MSGSVEMRSTMGAEHFEHELVFTIDGKTVRGMRQWAMQGDLRQAALEINTFLQPERRPADHVIEHDRCELRPASLNL
jgi:hypothetical protein